MGRFRLISSTKSKLFFACANTPDDGVFAGPEGLKTNCTISRKIIDFKWLHP